MEKERKQWRLSEPDWKSEVIVFLLLMASAFFINRGIKIKGLFMDDLYMWSCYGEQTFREFVFPVGGTRCRFVFYLAAYLQMALIGIKLDWFVPCNIIINGLISCTVLVCACPGIGYWDFYADFSICFPGWPITRSLRPVD